MIMEKVLRLYIIALVVLIVGVVAGKMIYFLMGG